jgi:hypothetical protein
MIAREHNDQDGGFPEGSKGIELSVYGRQVKIRSV